VSTMDHVDFDTPFDRRAMLKGIGAVSAVGALAAVSPEAALARAGHHHHHHPNQALLDRYWKTLNAGMASSNGDFSEMADVYAATGTLTQSNPAGVTVVSHGIDAIIAFYAAAWVKFHGYQWTRDSTRWLARDVALNYEHAGSPPLSVPGRCAHLFVFRHHRLHTLDWVTFFAGTP
jgi:hypothetical protein